MMAARYDLRPARPDELDWAAGIARESFDAVLHPYLVLAQHGVAKWWRVIVDHPGAAPGTTLSVLADIDDNAVAWSDLRDDASGTAFLSLIVLDPEVRGRGLASQLLRGYLQQRPHVTAMELDVFATNERALRYYQRLGFVEIARQQWWTAPLGGSGSPPAWTSANFHASAARHEVYGFTQFSGAAGGRSVEFGVMGPHVVRFGSSAHLVDEVVHAVARSAFPGVDTAFTVLPAEEVRPVPGASALVTSLRLRSANIRELLEAT